MIDPHHQGTEPAPTAGIDWSSTEHAIAVVDSHGVQLQRFTITHTTPGLRDLVRRLHRAGVVEVAIERGDGPVVDALLDAQLTVVVIAPNRLKNLRSRYGSAGNKDDGFDAYVLADTLRTDRARLRPLTRDSEATLTLRMTVRARQDLVAARVAMGNQLRAHLQTTLPGAIGLFRDIDSPITLRFLTRFPSQDKTDWLSKTRLGNWLRSVGYNHLANLEQLWAHLHDAPRGTSGAQAGPRAAITLTLVAALSVAARADQHPRRPHRRAAGHPPRCRDLHLPAPLRHRARSTTARRDRRRTRPIPHPRVLGLPGWRRALDQTVRQGQDRHLPLGSGQTTTRCRHRLRRRLPPRQPLGRRPLPTSPRPRPRPPPRRAHPRPRLAAHHLALLARPTALRPHQTPRPTTPPEPSRLTQGYSCRRWCSAELPMRGRRLRCSCVPDIEV